MGRCLSELPKSVIFLKSQVVNGTYIIVLLRAVILASQLKVIDGLHRNNLKRLCEKIAKTYRILSFDGGGSRELVTQALLPPIFLPATTALVNTSKPLLK